MPVYSFSIKTKEVPCQPSLDRMARVFPSKIELWEEVKSKGQRDIKKKGGHESQVVKTTTK